MAKDWAKAFYKSAAWLKCRQAFIDERIMIDGGMCQGCHQKLGYIVHHKTHLTQQNINDPEVSLSFSNLSYECKDCHDAHEGHGFGNHEAQTVFFDYNGDCTYALSPPIDRP